LEIIFIGLAVLALVYLQKYLYYHYWDLGLNMDARFSSKEAFEGDRLYVIETLTNQKFLPLPWVFSKLRMPYNLEIVGGGNDTRQQGELFSVMMYQSIRRRFSFVCNKRGFYTINRIQLSASNILYTEEFNKDWHINGQLVVFPKLIDDCPQLELIYKRIDADVLFNQILNPDPFEFRGIREYQATDAFRDINFKATAITQQLMVNIHAPTSAKKLNIILNLEKPPYDAEIYEQAIRLCATIASYYIGENVMVGLHSNGRDIGTREEITLGAGASTTHLYNIYESLARIELLLRIAPMANYLETLTDNETVYLIISPYHQADFLRAFEDLENRGISAFLIIPGDNEKITIWGAD